MTSEIITEITTIDGQKWKVFSLTERDVLDMEFGCKDIIWQLAAKSLRIPYAEFKSWPLVDAMKVVNYCGDYLKLFGAVK